MRGVLGRGKTAQKGETWRPSSGPACSRPLRQSVLGRHASAASQPLPHSCTPAGLCALCPPPHLRHPLSLASARTTYTRLQDFALFALADATTPPWPNVTHLSQTTVANLTNANVTNALLDELQVREPEGTR